MYASLTAFIVAVCAIVVGYRINKWTDNQLFKMNKPSRDKSTKEN